MQTTAGQDASIAPGHRRIASLTGITAVIQGTATAKPKKPNTRQAAAPSTVSAPAFGLLRATIVSLHEPSPLHATRMPALMPLRSSVSPG